MDTPDFPPNSEASKTPPDEKKIEPVVSGEVKRRKKSLRRQFADTFVQGDMKSAAGWVAFEVLLPGARDLVWEMGSQGLAKLIFGATRRRGATPPQAGSTGYIPYQSYASGVVSRFQSPYQTGPQRAFSRQARARHNFDEIVLSDRTEAEEVIDRLFELVSRYDSASVADLYELVGVAATHTDNRWGWTDLQGAGVSRVHGGYLLDLPAPQPLA